MSNGYFMLQRRRFVYFWTLLFLSSLFVVVVVAIPTVEINSVYAQSLSDATGLINRINIPTDTGTYEVMITSSFDILDHSFDVDNKRLTLNTSPGLSKNIAEIIIPVNLLSGDITLYVDDVLHDPVVRSTNEVSFLVLRFSDDVEPTLRDGYIIDIIGTKTDVSVYTPAPSSDYILPDHIINNNNDDGDDDDVNGSNDGIDDSMDDNNEHGAVSDSAVSDSAVSDSGNGGGCLVATAAFGSEFSHHIQQLREIRDTKIASTESGRVFLNEFNSIYYTFSPFVADYQRENVMLQDITRFYLGPMLLSLGIMHNAQAGSEVDILTFGVSVIALNIGMYIVAPIAVLMILFRSCIR